MSHQKPDVNVNIFTCTIKFEDIVHLIGNLKELEENYDFDSSIYLHSRDGSTYSYESAKQALDKDYPNNVDLLSKKSLIQGIHIAKHGAFTFYISKDTGSISLSKTLGSVIGNVFVESAIYYLKLRTSSIVSFLRNSLWPIIILQGMAIVSGIYFNNYISTYLSGVLTILIITLSMFLDRGKIVMGTDKDSFWLRKRDDILIALASLITGYLLGLLTPFILKGN